MKSYIKLQTELRNIKKISERFTVASVSFGEKNKAGQWENIWVSINFYGDHNLAEHTIYDITGNVGVKVAYGEYPAQLMVHCKTIAIISKEEVAPVKTVPNTDIPLEISEDSIPF